MTTADRSAPPGVATSVIENRSPLVGRRLAAWLVAAVAGLACGACGGGTRKATTTPDKAKVADKDQPGTDDAGAAGGTGGDTSGSAAAGTPGEPPPPPVVTMPNYDPDPAQARSQVEKHLQIARTSLSTSIPDPDTALREAKMALEIDAASVDAAAMVAFAYYHKKLYETAELVLDDLFKREAAKQNANVYYVYGLVYDQTSRPEQAVLSYRKATELDGNHASALINLGVHQLRNTRYGEALQTFERLVNQFRRSDAITLTSLGSAYRGHAADFPAGTPNHDDNVRRAEAAYKRALKSNASYGPAYYNLGLLYLDNDPFPGLADTLLRLNTARTYFDQYKNMPGVDMKLYDDVMKDVTRAIKRAERQQKKGKSTGSTPAATPATTPAATPTARPRAGARPGGNP